MIDIVSVNRQDSIAIGDDGEIYPITNWLDDRGIELDDPEGAIYAIAGRGGVWFTIYLEQFEPVATQ